MSPLCFLQSKPTNLFIHSNYSLRKQNIGFIGAILPWHVIFSCPPMKYDEVQAGTTDQHLTKENIHVDLFRGNTSRHFFFFSIMVKRKYWVTVCSWLLLPWCFVSVCGTAVIQLIFLLTETTLSRDPRFRFCTTVVYGSVLTAHKMRNVGWI